MGNLCGDFTQDLGYKRNSNNLLAYSTYTLAGTGISAAGAAATLLEGGLALITFAAVAPPILLGVAFSATSIILHETIPLFLWNDKAKQEAFNGQLVDYLEEKLRSKIIENMCDDYKEKIRE